MPPSTHQPCGAPWYVCVSTRILSLAQVLSGLDHVDLLDMDAQGGEASLVRSAADAVALRKVRRIHVETHSDDASVERRRSRVSGRRGLEVDVAHPHGR